MIARSIHETICEKAGKFPVLVLTGVRQCGKSTLLKSSFPDYTYVSLEDPDIRTFASDDPRGFLNRYSTHTIIDEAQQVPELFSYIQTIVDANNECGQFILSGSHNFLLMQSVSQSLAGRACILELEPLSAKELNEAGLLPDVDNFLIKGGFPRLYDKKISPKEFFTSYTQTYVERDIRILRNISNSATFTRFLKLCATRAGAVLNVTSLAQDCSINVATANSWLSILEASYVVFRLQPYYRNYAKRLVKSPKLYFNDTGLLCHLLNIHTKDSLFNSGLRGNIFENMVIGEFIKKCNFCGEKPQIYYWRDSNQNEIDLLVENDGGLFAYEIKSAETMNSKFYEALEKLMERADIPSDHAAVIYDGEASFRGNKRNFIRWDEI